MSNFVVVSPEELKALIGAAVTEAMAKGPQGTGPEVLTRESVAVVLDIHPNVVSRYIRDLGLPAHKVGGEWRFLRSEVMAWLASQPKKESA